MDLKAAQDRYLERAAEADARGAVDLVLGLLDDGVPAEDVLLRVIAPVQRRVGELWAANTWSVAREHAATSVSETAVAAVAVHARPRPARGRITVACTDGEYHALPARLLAEVLRLRGHRVDFLGASVPGGHLLSYLHQTGPDAVAVSCTLPTRLLRAHGLITACRAAGVPVLAGGAGFGPDGRYARTLGADAWAPTADAAADILDSGGLPAFPPVPDGALRVADKETAELLRRRTALLAAVLDDLGRAYPPMSAYDPEQLERTAEDLGHIADFLSTALFVDDPALFTGFVTWTRDILLARGVPPEPLVTGLRVMRDRLPGLPRARELLTEGIRAAMAGLA
ncbi:methanogenic corrinoid protein MtbC1 [Thermocatellispora tengchongensis]|uniref:Methanogenic corrinoid protein MtbC1 n=2 Tax=Thermocatellispora tengchongensis TaxID=1073253 RepID=A0A840NZ07_9ACTN|nr:cobalamin-dependent protein [Thermocatellispora tengchongensis]MBB5130370.1 methanogenic corrinoid protein MtbC1 [Thermocatellispora tengchongensis]